MREPRPPDRPPAAAPAGNPWGCRKMDMPILIQQYMAELRRALGVSRSLAERILCEIEEHLLEAAHQEEACGCSAEEAQRRVIARFGAPEDVAKWWAELYPSDTGER